MSYTLNGTRWTIVDPVTFSFVPDGTDVGGSPSNLTTTWDSLGDWKAQVRKAFAKWSAAAAIDFSEIDDDGSSIGISGGQQGDTRFGDIRFCGIDLGPSGTLALCYPGPPLNGGTNSGDILFNTNSGLSWHIGSIFDIQTVVLHEIGHSIGIGHSDNSASVIYPAYNGTKNSLETDDVDAALAIYGARGDDPYEPNASAATAREIGHLNDSNKQIKVSNCGIKRLTDADWFTQIVPCNCPGQFTVSIQSKYFSTLKPKMMVYNSSVDLIGTVTGTNYGDQVSLTVYDQPTSTIVRPGERYYVRVLPATSIDGYSGRYGLLWNMGSGTMTEIPRPGTYVGSQEDQGGGTVSFEAGRSLFRRISRGDMNHA